jgi:PEP-CTERM motif
MKLDMTTLKHPLFSLATFAAGVVFSTGMARATVYEFVSSGTCSEACAGTASITPGDGTLTIVLTDTQANPRSAGDLLSSIEITPSGSLGTPTLFSQNGELITVSSNTGPYTITAGPPTHWGVGTSGGQIVLETAGPFAEPHQPINMIIGPPDGSGNYSNGNSSVVDGHFSPYINGTGTFVIDDLAITASTRISAVTFNFGTGPDTFLPGVPVPEPSTWAMMLFGFAGLAYAGYRKAKTARTALSTV